MKHYIFIRDSGDFSDILAEACLVDCIRHKYSWHKHLYIVLDGAKADGALESYLSLKYGDEMLSQVCEDFSPVVGVDYVRAHEFN